MFLILSLVLALLPLLGIGWIAINRSLTTVDGLFTSLILLTISAPLGMSALFELKQRLAGGPSSPARLPQGAASAFELVQRGKVEKVDFFESPVGQPNKSIVSLLNGDGPLQTIVLEGDMRNALPTGQKVEITFRKAAGYNVLLNVRYA
jgi:hypothetical protein